MMITQGRQFVTPLTFFQFIAHLEQSGSLIPGAWSVKLTFMVCKTYIFINSSLLLTKTENRTKKSLTEL